jgi:protein tyrosine/serine phosphatase
MTIRFNIRRFIRRAGIGLAGILALGGAYLGALQLTGNFNTVVSGELYRSGQLGSAQIEDYAKRFGIKTIINLRGDNTGSAWYDAEVAVARRLNVSHVNFGISARRELTSVQAAALIDLMKTAQKPILIHCQAGADRSGLASALYLAAIKRSDEATAEGQLSIRFGHFSLPFIPEYAMDRTFEALEPALGFRSRDPRAAQEGVKPLLTTDSLEQRTQ